MTYDNSVIEWMNEILRQEAEKGSLILKNSSVHSDRRQPAIFIVGLPRSGTTLLHQMLVKRLRIGYIDNLIARFWAYPPVGIELSRQLIADSARACMPMISDLGRTPGPEGPHEFGYFWNHWFKFDGTTAHHANEQTRSMFDISGLRHVLLEIQNMFALPVLFKNLQCGFQADIVQEAYPESIFIYVERNISEIGRSILSARKRYYKSFETWWSIKPLGWPEDVPKSGPGEEVAWQVFEGKKQIKARLRHLKNVISIHYNDILAKPEEAIKSVASAIKSNGGSVKFRGKPIHPLSKLKKPEVPSQFMTDFESQFKRYQANIL